MLTKINVQSFKSLDQEELELKPLTILTGTNSSGKSSVIQAIMLTLKLSNAANRYSMEKITRYLNDFAAIRNKKTNAKVISIMLETDSGISNLVLTPDLIIHPDELDYVFEPIDPAPAPELLYLNANRMGAQEEVSLSDMRVGHHGEFLFSTFEKNKSRPVSGGLVKFGHSKTLSYQLAEWLTFITETHSELVTESSSDKVSVTFRIKDLDGTVSPLNLGAGMSYICKVLIICLMAKKGDLILLENPEVQLHPKAQANLGVFLTHVASNGIQLIVETHCEHLINKIAYQVYDEAITPEKVIIHYKPDVDHHFISLSIDETGHYLDEQGKSVAFPSGFFDATLDDLRSMR